MSRPKTLSERVKDSNERRGISKVPLDQDANIILIKHKTKYNLKNLSDAVRHLRDRFQSKGVKK